MRISEVEQGKGMLFGDSYELGKTFHCQIKKNKLLIINRKEIPGKKVNKKGILLLNILNYTS